jgi:hypothetical protein
VAEASGDVQDRKVEVRVGKLCLGGGSAAYGAVEGRSVITDLKECIGTG